MKYKRFGKTNWKVSNICVGTVELGMKYGLYSNGEKAIPSQQKSIDLLLESFDNGINFLDTAPAYGNSEEIVGKAIQKWNKKIYLATKIENFSDKPDKSELRKRIKLSITNSLRNLKVDQIDLLQIHSMNIKDDTYLYTLEILQKYLDKEIIGALGATVYEVEEAKAAIQSTLISAIQVQYNLLDQKMADEVFSLANNNDIAILSRSTFLKGALTKRMSYLPSTLTELKKLVGKAKLFANEYSESLTSFALKFCISNEQINAVLIGIRNSDELNYALEVCNDEPLSKSTLDKTFILKSFSKEIDPRNWS